MVVIDIVQPFLKSGASFPIQVMRKTLGDVTVTFKVGNQSRDFGLDGGAAQASITFQIPGGVLRTFTVDNWGSAPAGSIVTLTATIPDGDKDSDTATVGT
ncbi:hypothetical protein [Myxococcus sp. SDU36]|uniref:hypothetical protein n=1 Tax=Myxococcus sp. SDU36 TaxID=2831967 RepID=UPI002543C15D|nr:hypothetical protein [Myxococcus sp. SDU36]WIG93075.1 hypothetical protein KGD87_20935 [Myxococcus sp. SDU36]